MALGEYVSVRTQRESFESLIALEKREIARNRGHEQHEVAVIYRAKGIPLEDAERFAAHVMRDPDVALDLMAREELGLNPDELGSPVAVAFSSMAAFASGVIVPVLPFLIFPVATAAPVAAVLTVIALLLTGGLTARMIGRPPLRGRFASRYLVELPRSSPMLLVGSPAGSQIPSSRSAARSQLRGRPSFVGATPHAKTAGATTIARGQRTVA
jgi:hypothetical protein